ncbi:hypothetical protein DKP76_08060 [Falsochrobactrum shanghaiense]|uniref:Uncharacterized protein n=1 Tax=Falsochrobactrum shanghaiense TaxID=2201899 RepID=A0A316J947_9HYPH|nr:hypothetical protein [Falsochrobactrum shanghaiense]PWL17718.1 hypothetical protein DKP76_08060 [Falsochrobactrum shanghaiense]
MIKRTRQVANLVLAATAAALLAGCAGGPEFQGVPQEGAAKTGTYPTFGRMPKAATAQITAEEKEQMMSSLDSDRTRLAATRSSNSGVTPAQAAALRKQAQEETDATLRQIEAGEE